MPTDLIDLRGASRVFGVAYSWLTREILDHRLPYYRDDRWNMLVSMKDVHRHAKYFRYKQRRKVIA